MGNSIQDEIFQRFLDVSRQQAAAIDASKQSLADLILQADEVRREFAQTSAATGSIKTSSTSGTSGTSGTQKDAGGSSVLSSVLHVFESGLGISPLIKG